MGERVLTLGQFHGEARSSGIEWRQRFSQVVTHRRGLVMRDRFFYSWEQGFEAADLDPTGSISGSSQLLLDIGLPCLDHP